MTDTQPQPNYRYTPSSAQSTRQILDSTSPSPSTNPNEEPFRPQNLRRKSSNYAEADAKARAAIAETLTSTAQGDITEVIMGDEESTETADVTSPSASWRPKPGRKQSWSQQDFKREMHMSAVADAGIGHGFTEAGKRTESE
jgi:hypothetical protein